MAQPKTIADAGLLPRSAINAERLEAGLSRKTWLAVAGVIWLLVLGFISL